MSKSSDHQECHCLVSDVRAVYAAQSRVAVNGKRIARPLNCNTICLNHLNAKAYDWKTRPMLSYTYTYNKSDQVYCGSYTTCLQNQFGRSCYIKASVSLSMDTSWKTSSLSLVELFLQKDKRFLPMDKYLT